MNKTIIEALSKILPAEHVAEVSRAIQGVINSEVSELKSNMQAKLNQAYEQLSEEKKADEAIAERGYQQAYQIVAGLMNRIDEQKVAFKKTIDEGFEEAYQELQKEKDKNSTLEGELYEEFDKKLQAMREMFIDKMDAFMDVQEAEIYEAAKRDLLSNPRLAEQRVVVERMAEILSDYLSSDDLAGVNSSRLEESHRQVESLRNQLRIVEAKSVKLAAQNNRLTEQLQETAQAINEATNQERKQRTNRRGNASGRGQRVVQEQLISEYAAPAANPSSNGKALTEAHDPLNDLLVLSGLMES